jgi:ribose 5-phosphate isomerase B
MSSIIAIGGDHAGYEYKEIIKKRLTEKGFMTLDFGANSPESADYPDFAHPVADAIEKKAAPLGVLVCGSGNGVCMTANKHAGIRAALCWNVELATLARSHNNANILCLPARFVSVELALTILDAFLNTSFEGGRHERRVGKIVC